VTVSIELLNYCVNFYHVSEDNCTFTNSIPCRSLHTLHNGTS